MPNTPTEPPRLYRLAENIEEDVGEASEWLLDADYAANRREALRLLYRARAAINSLIADIEAIDA